MYTAMYIELPVLVFKYSMFQILLTLYKSVGSDCKLALTVIKAEKPVPELVLELIWKKLGAVSSPMILYEI